MKIAIGALLLAFIAAPVANAAQPVLGGGGMTTITEGDAATSFGQTLTVGSAGTYGNGYLDFAVSGATNADVLGVTTTGSAVTTNGIVSIVGTTVYLGNGSSADPIGSVDATRNGANGVLRINFSSEFTNGGFENGTTTGWTVMNQNINLGVTQIAGFTSQDTSNYSANPGHVNQDNDPGSLTYTTTIVSDEKSEGTYAVRLFSKGTSLNGCDVVHGPAIYSSAFQAGANDVISFDWRAFQGDDDYHVFGYILNTATGVQTEVIDATGSGNTSWATRTVTIPATGTYRFVFVSGTWDRTCYRGVGASLYIDNVEVFGSRANDGVVQQLARMATYRTTSDNPPASRTITISARSASNETGSTTETITITPVNDAPTLSSASTSYSDTSARDDFAVRTGTLAATDPDSGTLEYGITGGTDDGTTVTLTKAYGTLAVTKANGNWTFTPDDDAINARTTATSDTYPITVSDGAASGTNTFTVQITSAAVDVAGAPALGTINAGDLELSVDFTAPTDGGDAAISDYEYSTDNGATWQARQDGNGTTSPLIITTLSTNGTSPLVASTSYDVRLRAVNSGGNGAASTATSATAVAVPSTPANVVATPSNGSVIVTWDAPNANGSAILDYTVTADNGVSSCTTPDGSTRTCTFTGLTNGTTYSFTVSARNAIGASAATTAVTAAPYGAFMPTQALELRTTIWRPLTDFMTAPDVPRLEGFTGENRVVITATNATVRITVTTGLDAVTGYPQADWTNGAASIGFTGTQSEVNAALATLEARGVSPGSGTTIDLDVSSGDLAYDPSTGRFYEFVATGVTWVEARCRAKYANGTFSNGATPDECVSNNGLALQRRTLGGAANGLRGYLASVTSAAENAYITGKVGTAEAWLGGSDRGHDKDWQWVDGPDAGTSFFHQTGYNASGPNTCGTGGSAVGGRYENWNTSEPNDWSNGCSGREDAMQILAGGTGKWNDYPATSNTMGYVIEYGGDGGTPPQTTNESSAGTVRNTPVITTSAATLVTTTTARLNGTVNPSAEATTAEWTIGEAADLSDGQSSPVGGALSGTSAVNVPLDVSGLVPNTLYRYRLSATNTVGPDASAIDSFTTLPPTPTGAAATPGDTQLVVTWTVPTPIGGAAVTWTATATPGNASCTSTNATATCTITGLANGTAYTVTVQGQNSGGTGTASGPSASATPAAVPGAPAISGTPTYGDESALVRWTAPASDGGAPVTGYTVTATPGGQTCTWTSGPLECEVTGLANGIAHTFTVTATNSAGTGAASSPSSAITPLGPPRAPTGVQAVAGIGLATVTWAAPDNGGTTITGYTVTASPGGQTCVWTSGPLECVVTGLSNGVAYSFTVTATNAEGTGPASAAAGPVTPQIGAVEPEDVEELAESSTNVTRGGDAQVAVACGVTVGTCETRVVLSVGNEIVSTTTGSLEAGASGTLALDLPPALQRQLARQGTLTVNVTITISSAAGTISVEVPLELEAPPADRAVKWQGRPRSDGATDLTASCVGTLVSRCDGVLTLYAAERPARGRQSGRIVVGTARVAGPAGSPIRVTARLNKAGRALLRKQRVLRVAPEVAFEGSTTTDKIRPYRLRLMNERQWLQAAIATLWVGGRPRLDLNLVLDQVKRGELDRGRAARLVERSILRRRQAAYREVRALPAPPRRLAPIERDLRRAFEQSIIANRHYIAYLKTGSDNSWGAAWKTSKRASATKARLVSRMQQAGRRSGIDLPPASRLWP